MFMGCPMEGALKVKLVCTEKEAGTKLERARAACNHTTKGAVYPYGHKDAHK